MIDDLADDDIRGILTATGDRPTQAFRNELRDRLTDEAAGKGRAAVVRPITSTPSSTRRWWVPASAAAAVIALVGGFLLLGGRSDTTPATDPDGEVTPTTLDFATTMQGLVGRQMVEIDSGVNPLPTFTLTGFTSGTDGGTVRVDGHDGCNGYSGQITVGGGALTEAQLGSTLIGCAFPTFIPNNGDQVTVLTDGLDVTRDGSVHRFVALDSIPPITTPADGVGSWAVDGTFVMTMSRDVVSAEPDTAGIQIGMCSGRWSIGDPGQILIEVDGGQDIDTCRTTAPVPDALWSGLTTGDHVASRFGGALLIETGGDVVRLTPANTSAELATALQDLVGVRLIATDFGFDGSHPTLTISDTATIGSAGTDLVIDGFDGCTSYRAEIRTVGNEIRQTSIDADDEVACPNDTMRPSAPDLIALLPDGISITHERTVYEFRRLDGRSVETTSDVIGTWTYFSLPVMTVTDEQITIGGCTVLWQILDPGQIIITVVGDDPEPCPVADDLPEPLLRTLTEGVQQTGQLGDEWFVDGDRLVIAIDGRVYWLDRGADAAPLTVPPTDTSVRPPADNADGISFEDGSAFGFRTGDIVSADEALDHVSSLLGVPTHDTGWFETTPDPTITDHEDCMGSRTIRTLWWHDFSLSFFEFQDVEQLWTWTVGDTRITRNGDRREPDLPDLTDQSGLTSNSDIPIGIGSTTGDLIDAYGDQARSLNTGTDLFDDGAVFWSVGNTGFLVLVRDDIVIGFGNQISFC